MTNYVYKYREDGTEGYRAAVVEFSDDAEVIAEAIIEPGWATAIDPSWAEPWYNLASWGEKDVNMPERVLGPQDVVVEESAEH